MNEMTEKHVGIRKVTTKVHTVFYNFIVTFQFCNLKLKSLKRFSCPETLHARYSSQDEERTLNKS